MTYTANGGGKTRLEQDDASEFKRQSLKAMRRRKHIKKYSFITLIIIALIMAVACVLAYIIDK